MSVASRRAPATAPIHNIAIVGIISVVGVWAAALTPLRSTGGAATLVTWAGITTILLTGMAIYLVRELRRRAANEAELAAERRELQAEVVRRRSAELAARTAQETLQDAIESISEAFVIFDADDRFAMCNDAFRALYYQGPAAPVPGTSFEALTRAGLANGQFPDAVGREDAWLAERLRHHRELDGSVEQRLPDGRHLLITERRMRNGGTAGLRIDITRLKQTEIQLRQLTESLDRIQRIAGIGSVEVALDTGRVTWSPQACAIFGIDLAAVQPSSDFVLSFVHPHDRDLVGKAVADSKTSGIAARPLEYRIIRADGVERVVHRDNAMLYDPDGQPTRRIVTFKDVTDLRTTEARLREMMENLDRAQRLAHMGSYTRDLDGSGRWSAEVYRIFGVGSESFEPDMESFLELVVPEDRPKVLAAHRQMAEASCPDPFEYRIRRPSGEIRYIHRITELIRDHTGRVTGTGGTLWDITELRAAEERQKELERQLLHSQKLEALGTLAGGVAHDLNNTLVPILSLSKLALEDLAADDPLREDIVTIVSASERARDLVKQILAFSRKQDVQKTRIDAAAVVREALQMLRVTLPSNIAFIERVADAPPILADAGQLQQVVVNLVTNAAQAIGAAAHASITVELSAVAASDAAGRPPGNLVQLRVADSGCGMPKAVLDRIFEPFFTTKGVGEGTGLGLSVVHGIVSGHNGTIAVKSKRGRGTLFTILLPVAEPAAAAVAAPALGAAA